MKTKLIILTIIIVIIIAWYLAVRQPDISIETTDRISKSFTARIGLKKYKYRLGPQGLNIPKVNFGYSATIETSSPRSAIIKIKRFSKTVKQQIINL